ncbi:MAG TPA: helix-turn-helix transcriptional regulator [Pirellulaceae bacterium]|nr:helix-turn-helix transcriptional regulator [Pirellulaceae bacterium]
MRYCFQLANLLQHKPDPRRRPGTIKQICEYTGLDRHQVAALLKNEVKYIPLEAIGKLCDYLIHRGICMPHELPGKLFALEPENFWELMARRHLLEICLGVRREEAEDSLDEAWVVTSDSILSGAIYSGISTFGMLGAQTEKERAEGKAAAAALLEEEAPPAEPEEPAINLAPPHPELLQQSLIWSPGKEEMLDASLSMARHAHERFWDHVHSKALVCVGSPKSNPVSELIIASVFGGQPFVSQDGVASPAQRHCPLFLRFRDKDPVYLTSCCGGRELAKGHAPEQPGIYYENSKGKWECCPWDERKQDAAFVFYVDRPSQGVVEMVLGGFSGRATRLLAHHLQRCAEKLWPPVYVGHGLRIGAYIVKFHLKDKGKGDRNLLFADEAPKIDIIPLDTDVIARRMIATGDE